MDAQFNNTLSPYKTYVPHSCDLQYISLMAVCSCPNANDYSKADRGTPFVREWTEIYLKDAIQRLQSQIAGFELQIEDVYTMQQMCAYEVCPSFSPEQIVAEQCLLYA